MGDDEENLASSGSSFETDSGNDTNDNQEKVLGGALPDLEDNRDYPYEAFVSGDEGYPLTWDWRTQYPLKHKDQLATWSCTAFTTTSYAEMLEMVENSTYTEFSPRWIYAWVTLGAGRGAYTRDAVLRFLYHGAAPESRFNSAPISEEHLTSKEGATLEVAEAAKVYRPKIATAVTDKTNLELLKQAIYQNHGITVGISNHVMYCPAYNEDNLICHDSLGGKDRYITRQQVEAGLLHSLWAIIDAPNEDWIMGKYWPQANAVLHAFTGKQNNDPDATTLDNALTVGNQPKVDEVMAKYQTGSNETEEQFKQRAISAIQNL